MRQPFQISMLANGRKGVYGIQIKARDGESVKLSLDQAGRLITSLAGALSNAHAENAQRGGK